MHVAHFQSLNALPKTANQETQTFVAARRSGGIMPWLQLYHGASVNGVTVTPATAGWLPSVAIRRLRFLLWAMVSKGIFMRSPQTAAVMSLILSFVDFSWAFPDSATKGADSNGVMPGTSSSVQDRIFRSLRTRHDAVLQALTRLQMTAGDNTEELELRRLQLKECVHVLDTSIAAAELQICQQQQQRRRTSRQQQAAKRPRDEADTQDERDAECTQPLMRYESVTVDDPTPLIFTAAEKEADSITVPTFVPATEGQVGKWHFQCRPPFSDAQRLVCRAVTSNRGFGAEELNTFFGRYGMLNATQILADGRPLPDSKTASATVTPAVKPAATPHKVEGMELPQNSEEEPAATAPNKDESHQWEEASKGADSLSVADSTVARLAWHKDIASSIHPSFIELWFVITLDSPLNGAAAIAEVNSAVVDFVAPAIEPVTSVGQMIPFDAAPLSAVPPSAKAPPIRPEDPAFGELLAETHEQDDTYDDAGYDDDGFVPDIVIDNVPYWVTPEQLEQLFGQYGKVQDIKLSTSDRNGAFLQCALVRMRNFEEALLASEEIHGSDVDGAEVVCGVLDPQLNITSIATGEIRQQTTLGLMAAPPAA